MSRRVKRKPTANCFTDFGKISFNIMNDMNFHTACHTPDHQRHPFCLKNFVCGNPINILVGVYKIKKDQISIDYENESVRDGTYTFSVDKDKLTLIGGEGTVGGTYTLTRWRKNR